MTDPRDTTQRHDPRNVDSGVRGPAERTAADEMEIAEQDTAEMDLADLETVEEDAAQDAAARGDDGDDANDLEADNAVEADSLETLDPDNAPA
jgi:hypothetical protein